MVRQPCEGVNPSNPISARRLRDCWGYLTLPYTVMLESGGAVRTLGALYQSVDNKTAMTFASAGYIAGVANLPTKTVRNHIDRLQRDGWIEKRKPRRRRTCTIQLTQRALHIRRNQPYATLPRWWGDHRFPSLGLLYATLVAEHCKREEVLENDVPGEDDDGNDYIPHLQEFSLGKLQKMTGLCVPTITKSRKILRQWGLIEEQQASAVDSMTIILTVLRGKLLGMVEDDGG